MRTFLKTFLNYILFTLGWTVAAIFTAAYVSNKLHAMLVFGFLVVTWSAIVNELFRD